MKRMMAVCALGFMLAGCGVGTDGDPIQISSMEGALDNGGYTTRDVCKACGCVASDVACNCGMPPSQKKLDCISNGGPVKSRLPSGLATSLGARATSASAAAPTEMPSFPGTGKTPFCLPGEVVHCTLGPPPVCTCVPAKKNVVTFAQ